MLENIRIVLVHTSHPGNIGAAARAMKTMGLKHLYLVKPKLFPHPKADEMSSHATDILQNAKIFDSVEDAIADCKLIVALSARTRAIPWPMLTPRASSSRIVKEYAGLPVALLFGSEQSGLTNQQLQLCNYHVQIPSNPEYSSLNLAAAVQVICYELKIAAMEDNKNEMHHWDFPPATAENMAYFYEHLEQTLLKIGALKLKSTRQMMTRLRRLFNRARPDEMEIGMLRGILTAINGDIVR